MQFKNLICPLLNAGLNWDPHGLKGGRDCRTVSGSEDSGSLSSLQGLDPLIC